MDAYLQFLKDMQVILDKKRTEEEMDTPEVKEPVKSSQKDESRECVIVNERSQHAEKHMNPEKVPLSEEIRGPLAPDRSGAEIQPVYGLPVPAAALWMLQKYNSANSTLAEVRGLIDSVEEDVYFDNAPFFVPKGELNLLVEDPQKTNPQVHSLLFDWGDDPMWMNGEVKPKMLLSQVDSSLKWKFPSENEAGAIVDSLRYISGGYYSFYRDSTEHHAELSHITLNGGAYEPTRAMNITTRKVDSFEHYPQEYGSVDIHVAEMPRKTLCAYILKNKLIPSACTDGAKENLKQLYAMVDEEILVLHEDEKKQPHLAIQRFGFQELLRKNVPWESQEERTTVILNTDEQEECVKHLLSLDEVRADITPEDPRRLEDPNGGVWELWEEPREGWELAGLSAPVYARNPRLDVLNSGVVGIDFGTKSTVVVALNGESGGEAILPVRVGTGRYEQQIHGQDYENPTVEAFIDLEQFKADYERDPGRPLTHWSDLTISYTAAMDRENQPDTRYYASYFSELKQWAGDSRRNVRVRDQRAVREQGEGVDQMLPPYLELKPGDMDPIEYYAYYIGLYINNMRTRRIYLEYLLSFPVTYSREVRDRILESFRRGLKRSLPRSIQEDPVCAGRFSVAEGAGEPAAYAVCALQEYGFVPRPGEKVYFGIFDFGGGTTDFDFGLWRRAEGAKERRYRYVIEHFGDSGDRYLGGENLLGKLAYYIFWENRDQLLQERIGFTRPPEEPERPGSELLVTDSQEAHTNTRRLVEALRPLWERHPDYQRRYADGILKIDLYRADGSSCPMELRVDAETLEKLLRDRIQKGVREFFQAFRSIFDQDKPYGDSMKQLRKINLFLAGNSSKSEILQSVFQEEMKRENEWISNLLEEEGQTLEDEKILELFYPLGTEESEEQLRQRAGGEEPQRVFRPSGKTGVAVGLLQCREGGKIKVINRQTVQGSERVREIPFRYWIGDGDDDEMFRKVLSRDSAYGQWEEYYDAGTRMFEFYCTTSPSAQFAGTLPVGGCRLFRLYIPESAVNEDWIICLRPVGPDRLEYAVAESLEAAAQGELKCEVMAVDLSIS